MPTCTSGKRCYSSFELAEEALIGAHIAYEFGNNAGPVGVYVCDECQQFHLTSQGEMSSRLKNLIESGELEKLRQARRWEEKFRRK